MAIYTQYLEIKIYTQYLEIKIYSTVLLVMVINKFLKTIYTPLIIIILIYIIIYILFSKTDAYLINIDARTDRLNTVTKHFTNHFNIIKTSAVYITDSIKEEHYPAIKLRNGHIGCGLSHVNIVKHALKNKLSTVLILEDDCKPTNHFLNWFPIKKWLDSNLDKWDIFIGGNCKYFWDKDEKKETIQPICKLDNEIKLYYTKIMCFQFIYINSKAYKRFITWENNMDIPIDGWPDKLNMKTISCTPFIAVQEISYSNIGGDISDSLKSFVETEKSISEVENKMKCY